MTYTIVTTFDSKSKSGKVYTVKRDQTGRLSCDCPPWIFNRYGDRTCYHTRSVEVMETAKAKSVETTKAKSVETAKAKAKARMEVKIQQLSSYLGSEPEQSSYLGPEGPRVVRRK